MKKLGKLNINPEKVMKNEELKALRGGYGSTICYEFGSMGDPTCGGRILGYLNCTWEDALDLCIELYNGSCVERG